MIEPKIRRVFNNGDPLLSIRLPSDGTRRKRRLLTPSAAPVTQPLILYSDPATVIGLDEGTNASFVLGNDLTLVPESGFVQILDGLLGPTCSMSDGSVISVISTQRGSGLGSLPFQACQVLYPSGELDTVQFPSTTGVYNGAALNMIVRWFDANGGEHAVAVSSYPYVSDWEISIGGLQPTLAVLTKVAGRWGPDSFYSLNDLQLALSSPTVVSATNCLYEKTNTFSETYWSSGGVTWLSVLPNGQIVLVQYFDDAGAFVNFCVMVVDLNLHELVSAYRLPQITDPTGGNTLPLPSLGGRFCAADPTSTTVTDMRAVIGTDLFAPTGQGGGSAPQSVTAISAISGLVVLTCANHGFGVGQWVAMNGFTSSLAALNDVEFYFGTQVIVAVTTNTFSVVNYAIANTSTLHGTPTARIKQGSPFFEVSVNATAKTITPTTQILLHDQEFGSCGTCIFDPEGNAIFWGNDSQQDFTGSPGRLFLKAGSNRSYVTQAPYNAGTFQDSYGTYVMRDYAIGLMNQNTAQSHPLIMDGDGTIWAMASANDNALLRSKLEYPLSAPANLQADPNFTLGTLTFGNLFTTPAYSTTTLPALPTGGGAVVNSLIITPSSVENPGTPQAWIIETIPLVPNQSVSAGAWFISPAQAGAFAPLLLFQDDTDTQFLIAVGNPVWIPANTWVYIVLDTFGPSSAAFGIPGSRDVASCALGFQGFQLQAKDPWYVVGASVTVGPSLSSTSIPVGTFTVPEPYQPSIEGGTLSIPYGQGGPGTGIVPQYLLQVNTNYYAGVS